MFDVARRDYPYFSTVDADGRFYLTGYGTRSSKTAGAASLLSISANGRSYQRTVSSWGARGSLPLTVDTAADGQVVLGWTPWKDAGWGAARFSPTLDRDPTYGRDGYAKHSCRCYSSAGTLTPDGLVLVGGTQNKQARTAVARFMPDGDWDQIVGTRWVDLFSGWEYWVEAETDAAGRVVMVGTAKTRTVDAVIARFSAVCSSGRPLTQFPQPPNDSFSWRRRGARRCRGVREPRCTPDPRCTLSAPTCPPGGGSQCRGRPGAPSPWPAASCRRALQLMPARRRRPRTRAALVAQLATQGRCSQTSAPLTGLDPRPGKRGVVDVAELSEPVQRLFGSVARDRPAGKHLRQLVPALGAHTDLAQDDLLGDVDRVGVCLRPDALGERLRLRRPLASGPRLLPHG
jgi:hypothetical protein